MTTLRVRPEAEPPTSTPEASIDVALQFLAAVDQAYQRLVEHPHIGTPVKTFEPRLADLRFWPVPGFDSPLVFFRRLASSRSCGCFMVRATIHSSSEERLDE